MQPPDRPTTDGRAASAPPNRRVSYAAVGALLLALIVRAVWLAIFPVDPIATVDAEGFHLLAVNVLAGRGFAIGWEPPFCPTAVRTPLYPLFLMGSYRALGNDPYRAVLVQLLLEVLTTALVVRLGFDLSGHRVGVLAGLLYAFNGTTQRYTGYLLSEALLLPLLAAALLTTARHLRWPSARRVALAGLLWGFALLTKPNVQYLVVLMTALVALCEWRRDQRLPGFLHPLTPLRPDSLRLTLIFWLALIAMLAPWILRNRIVFDRWMLSSAFEENLARVGVPATLAQVEGARAEPWTATWEHYYDRFVADAGARFGWCAVTAQREVCAELRQRETQIARAARDVVLAQPWAYVRAHARGVWRSLRDPGHRTWYRALAGRDWETTGVLGDLWPRIVWSLERGAIGDALSALWSERVSRPPAAAALIWWALVAGRAAVWGLVTRGAWRLRRRLWALLPLVLTMVYLATLPGPIAYDRFYLPGIPAVVLLTAIGITPEKAV